MLTKNNQSQAINTFGLQLLEAVDTVARERGIAAEEVFDAMEKAIKKVAAQKYGYLNDIRAKINRNTGALSLFRVLTIVEEVEDDKREITKDHPKALAINGVTGDEILEELPLFDFHRGQRQPFFQIVMGRIREAEKEREYEAYKDKVGEIVSGVVKRVELDNVFVELTNKAEAFMHRSQAIVREKLVPGAKIRALIVDVKQDMKNAQVTLSRSSLDFVKKLFAQEIPEIYNGVIEIKAISREAGSRSKVALISHDVTIDPIRKTLGDKGANLQGILSELRGEKIDLVQYSENIAQFAINAFYPTEVDKVIVDEDRHCLEVVVKDESLSLVIGRRGQNINLLSRLVGWHIEAIGIEEEKEKRQIETEEKIQYFKDALDVDNVIAHLLVIKGFSKVEELLDNDNNDALEDIKEFNQDIIEEVKSRASEYILKRTDAIKEELRLLEVKTDLIDFNMLNVDEILILAKANIKSLSDLADLDIAELLDIMPKGTDMQRASDIIMKARENW